jgi:hypothetical protein
VFNGLWDLPIGEERDSGDKPEPHREWLVRCFSHIELASIFTAESGRPVNPLAGLDSNRSHAFPLSSRPLGLGRNALQNPAVVTLNLRVLKYFLLVSRNAWTLS